MAHRLSILVYAVLLVGCVKVTDGSTVGGPAGTGGSGSPADSAVEDGGETAEAGGEGGADGGEEPAGGSGGANPDGGSAGSGGSGGAGGGAPREAALSAADPLYNRYEAPGADNVCESDADCLVSGCNNEVCAAESVETTCEVIPVPDGKCGCVNGECIWYRATGEAGTGGTGGTAGSGCDIDDDCVLYSNYCDGCTCEALLKNEREPVCTGTLVTCFVDPCLNHIAACVNGACVSR
jgi:eight-cysteine-cluster-containing protein